MDFKLCSLLIFLAVFNLTVAVEVRHGDPAITFQSKRDNQSFVGSKVPDASPGYLNVEVKNRGGLGAVKPWPQKFDEARSPRLFETSLVDENVKDGLANVTSLRNSNPPPPDQAAKMARYIVKTANWTSIATISTRPPMKGYPCASVVALSDGPPGKSTGVPYMYVTALDLSVQDLKVNPKTSLTMTLAQTDYCLNNKLDPEDPRCAHVILTGKFVKLPNGTDEEAFARQSLFSKHAVMATWPADHHFFFAKLDIKNILVLDYFGGAKTVSPKDYYRAKLYG